MFDFTDDDEVKGFEALPAGNYLASVFEAEVKETKAGTGTLIKIQFKVVDGNYENRRFFANYNITNPNDEAQRIGRGQLKNMMSCAGCTDFKLEDVRTLVGLVVVVKLAFKTDNYGDGNEVRGYESKGAWNSEPSSTDTNENIPF